MKGLWADRNRGPQDVVEPIDTAGTPAAPAEKIEESGVPKSKPSRLPAILAGTLVGIAFVPKLAQTIHTPSPEPYVPPEPVLPAVPLGPYQQQPLLTYPQRPIRLYEGQKIPNKLFFKLKDHDKGQADFKSKVKNADEDIGVITSAPISKLLKNHIFMPKGDNDAGILISEDDGPSPDISLSIIVYGAKSHRVRNIEGYKFIEHFGNNKTLMPTEKLARQLGTRLVGKMTRGGKSADATITFGGPVLKSPQSLPKQTQPMPPRLPGSPQPAPGYTPPTDPIRI